MKKLILIVLAAMLLTPSIVQSQDVITLTTRYKVDEGAAVMGIWDLQFSSGKDTISVILRAKENGVFIDNARYELSHTWSNHDASVCTRTVCPMHEQEEGLHTEATDMIAILKALFEAGSADSIDRIILMKMQAEFPELAGGIASE